MNKRFFGVLIFAFVVATFGGLITYRSLLNRAPQSPKTAAPTVKLVLAAHDLAMGTLLKENDVRLADYSGPVPAGSVTDINAVVKRGVLATIYSNEPVLESRLAPLGAGGGLAAMIPPGMRAVAVPVNEIAGVAGFVVPGMRVDVLISGNSPGGNGNLGTMTKTMLQNIEVLSAGQDFKKDSEGKPITVQVVNLLVTPDQAEQLSLARSQTTVQLVLRNPLDYQETKTSGTALAYLFSGGKLQLPPPGPARTGDIPQPVSRPAAKTLRAVAAAPAKKEPPFVMEIFAGTKRSETKFDGNGEGK
jgi:pilus assembly protein CpaB